MRVSSVDCASYFCSHGVEGITSIPGGACGLGERGQALHEIVCGLADASEGFHNEEDEGRSYSRRALAVDASFSRLLVGCTAELDKCRAAADARGCGRVYDCHVDQKVQASECYADVHSVLVWSLGLVELVARFDYA